MNIFKKFLSSCGPQLTPHIINISLYYILQHNDVAILKLSSSVKYTKTVRPVCLAPYGANVPGETTATVVGWGMLSHVGPRPDILQEITFKTWDNQRCSSTYGSNAPGGITDHMLCAGQKGQDSCMVRKQSDR